MFYSNTGISTSHNYAVALKKGQTKTFMALLRPLEAGRLMWRFRFSNAIDSTWDDGSFTRAGMPGGRFAIESAYAGCADATANVRNMTPVFFRCGEGGVVEPGAWAVSAPVEINVPPEGYVAFRWRLRAVEDALLPATPDSRALTMASDIDGLELTRESLVCLPDAFEADRPISLRMVFMGDSITQGVGTRVDCAEQWAARIAMGVGRSAGVWNIGLGYGRAEDAASDGAWLGKAAGADVVNLCFGVNDILHGTGSAQALMSDLRRIVSALRRRNPSVYIVMFTVPPFDWQGEHIAIWREVNSAILLNEFGADAVFDTVGILGHPAPQEYISFFGGHPDGRGGAALAGEYLSKLWPRIKTGADGQTGRSASL